MELGVPPPATPGKKNTRSRPKSSIRVRKSSRLVSFLVFLLLAFAFWFTQNMQRDFVRTLRVPVVYKTLSAQQATAQQIPSYIEVQVQDKGFEHLRYSLLRMPPVELGIVEDGVHGELLGIQRQRLHEALLKDLSSTAVILQITPTEILIPLSQRSQKKVPVVAGFEVMAATGFVASAPVFSPDSVIVYGADEVLSKIERVVTALLKATALRAPLEQYVDLHFPEGVYSEVKQTKVGISVDELTEYKIMLPVYPQNVPDGQRLSTLPTSVELQVTLPRARYSELKDEVFELGVLYPENPDAMQDLPVILLKKPSWVQHYKVKPEHVQYILENTHP